MWITGFQRLKIPFVIERRIPAIDTEPVIDPIGGKLASIAFPDGDKQFGDSFGIGIFVLLGICFWRKGRGNSGWAKYMGEKGGSASHLLP